MPDRGMSDRPACTVVCLDCSPRHRWEQPFPSLEAADRWQQAHTAQWGHERFDRVVADDEPRG